jgi:photosystem II stability/assembly factor-like uncharacterized protein
MFESLHWRNIGPHRGGRVTCVVGDPTNRQVFYMGSCGGGVFKTDDGGDHWYNVTDAYLNTSAIGAIAMAPSNNNILYVGTGESTIRSNVSHGDGVYKTTDGGKTWEHCGLEATRHIGQITVHPQDPNTVLVAALGHAWGDNEERGVYKTTDGGKTWTKTLYKSPRAGAVDLSQDLNNPNTVYAAVWQGRRYPWAASSGGDDSSLWNSTDGGDTWQDITERLGFQGILGKIGVAISPANPDRIWALVEAEDGAMCRSDDGGQTWKRVSDNPELRRRAWYYTHIFADPSDADTVWVLNLQCWKSSDGGATYEAIPTPHGDNHGLWIDPNDSNRIIEGNDGGACVSYNGGKTWSTILNQPTAQFYHVTTDTQQPYHVYGSQQDNWAMRLPSVSFEGAISWKDYVEPGGGESGYIAIKPTEPGTVFGGGIGTGLGHGRLRAWNPQTRQSRNVTVWPEVHGFGAGTEKHKYRFQWTFPLEISPHDPDKLYACSNHVHVSTDEGASWETISPDLTRNDSEKQQSSGGPITSDNSGAEIYCTIFAFQESPHQAGVLWAGSDDGLIHLSKDGGKNWDNITPPADMLPEWSRISIIELSPHQEGKAYVAANRYQLDDNRPYLLKTEDHGQSWTEINNGIRPDDITRTIREDPNKQGLLYCGTETGLYVSFDDGGSWQSLQPQGVRGLPNTMPVTPIYDLVIKGTDMVVATNGRSFWVLDDVTPLHQIADTNKDRITLYQPRDTVRWRINQGFMRTEDPTRYGYKMVGPVTVTTQLKRDLYGNNVEQFVNAGQNPPEGVLIHWWLPAETDNEVKLIILDKDGNELRTYSSKADKDSDKLPVRAGANRLRWDLRTQPPAELQGEESANRMVAMMMMNATPKAPPGEYQVRLTTDGVEQTQSFKLLIDPRIPVSADDLQAQYELKSQIRDRLSEVNETINSLRSVREQVDQWVARANDNEEIKAEADKLKEKLGALETDLMLVDTGKPKMGSSGVREKLGALAGMTDESDHAPTQQAHEVYGNLAEDAVTYRQRLNTIVGSDIDAFTNLLQRHNVPLISAQAPAKIAARREAAAD